MKTFLFGVFALLLAVLPAFAEKQPFERYQPIVDRQMFGPLPPGFDPTKMPSEVQKSSMSDKQLTQEQEKLQSSIHFSVINVTPDGVTAVGFTDNSDPKAPVHYYLKVGEKRNGWEVKEADAAKASMTIAKGDIEVSLTIGGDSSKNADATAKASGGAKPAAGRNALRGGLLGGGSSLLSRRRQRRQAEAAAKAEADAAAQEKEAERQAQAEQEKQQREAERAEQRQQLLAIQEELKRVREAKTAAKGDEEAGSNEDN